MPGTRKQECLTTLRFVLRRLRCRERPLEFMFHPWSAKNHLRPLGVYFRPFNSSFWLKKKVLANQIRIEPDIFLLNSPLVFANRRSICLPFRPSNSKTLGNGIGREIFPSNTGLVLANRRCIHQGNNLLSLHWRSMSGTKMAWYPTRLPQATNRF